MHKKLLISLLISALGTGTLTACNSGTAPLPSSPTSITTNSGPSLKSIETINNVNTEVQALLDAQEPYPPQKLMELIEQIDKLKDEENSPELQMAYSNILSAINSNKFIYEPTISQAFDPFELEKYQKFQRENKFVIHDMLNALVRTLGNMNLTTSDNQVQFANAIKMKKFGGNIEILKSLATSLGNMHITDPEAQRLILYSIQYNTLNANSFGRNTTVLKLLLSSLIKMNITDQYAQQHFAKLAIDEVFGMSNEVYKNIIFGILNMNTAHPDVQAKLIQALMHNLSNVKDDLDILQTVAAKLGTMNITDANAQLIITDQIYDGFFGSNPEILKSLITSLSNMNITDRKVQQSIAACIDKGVFGDNPEVLMNLKNLVFSLDITSPSAQYYILSAINKHQFGELSESEIKSLYSHWIVSGTIRKRFPDFFTDDKYFFGKLQEFETTTPELESLTFGNQKINLSLALGTIKNLNDNALAYGSFGVVYDKLGNPDLLIIAGEGLIDSDDYDTQRRIREFLNIMDIDISYHSNNYKGLELIKVFDLKNLKAGFPTIMDNLSSSSPEFKRLPRWIQERVKANEFDINNYKDSNLLQFAMSFAESLPEQTQLNATLVDAIKLVVQANGERVVLNANADEDMKLKDTINQEMNSFYGLPEDHQWNLIENKLTEFWGTLQNRESKLKLIYLLGQLAKDGALGYHYGAKNQANEFYYYLTIACTKKLIAEDQHDPATSKRSKQSVVILNDYLVTGGCIQAGTNVLAEKNKQVASIWNKK